MERATMEGTFTFETLSKQEAQERRAPRLTRLEGHFFQELRTYLELLEVSYRKEQERNPASKKVQFLGDELRNARRKAEALWEARERKIVLTALANARVPSSATTLPEGLTREEQPLFESLTRIFLDTQARMLPGEPPIVESPAQDRAIVHATAGGSMSAPSAPPRGGATVPVPAPATAPPAGAEETETVRALADIPPFIGFDGKTYRIKKGEVLTLPKRFVKILKDRGQVALIA